MTGEASPCRHAELKYVHWLAAGEGEQKNSQTKSKNRGPPRKFILDRGATKTRNLPPPPHTTLHNTQEARKAILCSPFIPSSPSLLFLLCILSPHSPSCCPLYRRLVVVPIPPSLCRSPHLFLPSPVLVTALNTPEGLDIMLFKDVLHHHLCFKLN